MSLNNIMDISRKIISETQLGEGNYLKNIEKKILKT